jgi:hypothetical protein
MKVRMARKMGEVMRNWIIFLILILVPGYAAAIPCSTTNHPSAAVGSATSRCGLTIHTQALCTSETALDDGWFDCGGAAGFINGIYYCVDYDPPAVSGGGYGGCACGHRVNLSGSLWNTVWVMQTMPSGCTSSSECLNICNNLFASDAVMSDIPVLLLNGLIVTGCGSNTDRIHKLMLQDWSTHSTSVQLQRFRLCNTTSQTTMYRCAAGHWGGAGGTSGQTTVPTCQQCPVAAFMTTAGGEVRGNSPAGSNLQTNCVVPAGSYMDTIGTFNTNSAPCPWRS